MQEPERFYNAGFGWICRKCEGETAEVGTTGRSRLLSEGEAEGKEPRLSTRALAEWADAARTVLKCPRCNAVEKIS